MNTDEFAAHQAKVLKAVRAEARSMAASLKAKQGALGLKERGELMKAMGYVIKMNRADGSVDGIGFKTKRYGMMKLWGVKPQTYSTRAGRTATLKAKNAQDWWSPVANARVPKLADKLASLQADLAVKVSQVVNFDGRKELG
jgi:hypothetical protein